MSISDKLSYLNYTKSAIADAIISKGGSVANSDTFRSYANKILDISTGKVLPVSGVTNLLLTNQDQQVTIKWTDPDDLIYEGVTLASWSGTKILRKEGSYPVSESDGILVVDSKVKNQYSVTGYIDSGLTNDTNYYYTLFPYTEDNAYNYNESNRVLGNPSGYKIFGIRIDLANSNQSTAVEYTDDSIGMDPGSSTWDTADIFNDIKPCLLKNGVVQYYLNPNDYTKKLDGTASDITTGNDGDVMIEFSKFAYMIYHDESYQYVKITKHPNAKSIDSRFCYYGFTRDTEGDRDKVYISAYLCYSLSSKLRSLSGKSPSSVSLTDARTYTRANGTGYDLIGWHQLKMLQCLFLIKYKSREQYVLGQGYSHYTLSSPANTGGTNTKGMYYGESTGKFQLKFAGIEDFVGNMYYFIDGVSTDASRYIWTAFNNFNSTNTGYTNTNIQCTAATESESYTKEIQGSNETGFIQKTGGASSTTYYGSFGRNKASGVTVLFGANWSLGVQSLFSIRFIPVSEIPLNSPINSNGMRIMYL